LELLLVARALAGPLGGVHGKAMKKNKHLLLWSSLGVLALLIAGAAEENFLKEWRRLQRSVRNGAAPIDVRLRQIVVPALAVTDRCVSCHVGMAPGERELSGPASVVAAHRDVVHDPASFGCTVCHAGQGRATEKRAAHGAQPHWPQPMIPASFAYAGCGSCHTHLKVPNLEQLRRGASLFERYDCLNCHRLDGRGGGVRPERPGFQEGPDLSRAGARGHRQDWYEHHLDRAASGDAVWREAFGPIPEADRQALETLLTCSVGAPGLIEAKSLFHSLGCRGCHKVNGVGGDDGPDLSRVGERDPGRLDFSRVPGERTLANWFAEHFRAPAVVVPGSLMPWFGLSDEQVHLLTSYMLSLRRSEFPEAFWPKDRIRAERFSEREFRTDAATLYGTFCASCHGRSGQGMRYPGMAPFPGVSNPDFLALAPDSFIMETIRRGRPGRRMPAWGEKEGGLRPEEISNLAPHLREMGGDVPYREGAGGPGRWIASSADGSGRILYDSHCAGCHGEKGSGGEGPALSNPVLLDTASDRYLLETVRAGRRGTVMEAFSRPSAVRSTLSVTEIEAIIAYLRSWEEKK